MRLRRPCVHDRYEPHRMADRWMEPLDCPGGEFLPEDAVGIFRFDKRELVPVSDAELQEEWVRRTTKRRMEQTMQAISAHFAAVDNPDQVGEPG